MNHDNDNNAPILISLNDAAKMTSLSRSMINRYRSENRWPAAVSLGDRRVAFLRTEVMAWIAERIANRHADNDNTTSTLKRTGTVVGHIDGRVALAPRTSA